jgi:signal transduction histidine kinase/Tfp pilus assembly protein PilF
MTIFPVKFISVRTNFLFLWILLTVSFLSASGQIQRSTADSLKTLAHSENVRNRVNAYVELTRLYWGTHIDSSYIFANKALEIAQKARNDEIIGDAYNNLGNVYLTDGQFEKSLPLYEIAMEYRLKLGDKQKIANTRNNQGYAYRNTNMYSEAIAAFKEAAEIFNEIGHHEDQAYMLMNVASTYSRINDSNKALEAAIQVANIFLQNDNKYGIAYTYNFIGDLHTNLNNHHLALEYIAKANELYIELNDIEGLTNTTNALGIIYGELDDSEKALEYYKKSLDLAIESNSLGGQSVAYNNIGFQESKLKNYAKALEAYQKSLKLSEQTDDFESLMNTYNNIAWVYLKQGQVDEAKKNVVNALKYQELNEKALFLAESYEILSQIYYKKGDYKRGFENLEKLRVINDSLFKSNSTKEYMEMQVRFETERKEKEIELLKKTDEIRNLELQRQKNLNIFWLLLSLLLIVFGVITIFNLRSKQKVNSLLTEKNLLLEETNKKLTESEKHLKEINLTKDRFFSLIAHDLKNPFNALMGFSELLYNNYTDYTQEESKELIKIIYDSSQNLYKLLDNLLQWSRSQLGSIMYSPELFPLHNVVKEEVEMLKPLANKKNVKITLRIEEFMIVWADKNLVAVVVRNLVSNAIKFSSNDDKILIAATEHENHVEISISDTGVGINKEDQDKLFRLDTSFTSRGTADEKGTGLGLLLCKEFVEKNGGTIWVESNEQKGSTFKFTLPSIRSSHKA